MKSALYRIGEYRAKSKKNQLKLWLISKLVDDKLWRIILAFGAEMERSGVGQRLDGKTDSVRIGK